ncbi:MAG: hypothetical protein CVV47_13340 [Spirochaetae bacterium HGW-Spirochaetae-3]|nr:MAG: hypothetical protein CVV47_13340 [Spirochaetae bacterium HGW-Spirochaetae-3]
MSDNTSKPIYAKPPLPLEAQADLLLNRGLQGIAKPDLIAVLGRVSYYRWRGYTYPYQDNTLPDTPFFDGAQWNWIQYDYEFDRDLRALVFDAIERVEVSLRTQLVLQVSLDHGARWYADSSLFFNRAAWSRDIKDLYADWERSKEVFVEHHKSTYDDNDPPPAWKILETTSLGILSRYYSNLNLALPCKQRIAGFWGFSRASTKVLVNWFHHLNLVRNICAHHGRLFSRILKVTPIFPTGSTPPWVDYWPNHNRIYASLCIVVKLLRAASPEVRIDDTLRSLIARLRPGQLPSLGFPGDWESQPLFAKDAHRGLQ